MCIAHYILSIGVYCSLHCVPWNTDRYGWHSRRGRGVLWISNNAAVPGWTTILHQWNPSLWKDVWTKLRQHWWARNNCGEARFECTMLLLIVSVIGVFWAQRSLRLPCKWTCGLYTPQINEGSLDECSKNLGCNGNTQVHKQTTHTATARHDCTIGLLSQRRSIEQTTKSNTNSIRTTALQAQKLYQNTTKLQQRPKHHLAPVQSHQSKTQYNMDTTQATYNDTTEYRLDIAKG